MQSRWHCCELVSVWDTRLGLLSYGDARDSRYPVPSRHNRAADLPLGTSSTVILVNTYGNYPSRAIAEVQVQYMHVHVRNPLDVSKVSTTRVHLKASRYQPCAKP